MVQGIKTLYLFLKHWQQKILKIKDERLWQSI